MIDVGLWISYILFVGAVAGMAVYSLINMLRDTKNAKGTLIGVGVLVGLFLLTFLLSSNELLPKYVDLGISPTQSKMIGAGLLLAYIIGFGTIAIAVYSEVRKIFMK
ncbi:MAG: hypothetical protein KBH11_08020 [Bacteroidia bacterium]|nr:hypothetical protein [Bacteroidota bacterium]MBP9083008.1 hypothetical protein [Bacteroidia bacterium]MBK7388711.1 hypothetical protein [Bacteroidota bacterium]MBK7968477.1 hypothetical protein [Bacteroidota bacterium]MBK8873509.1 hypothetical protein [Bacteroidota bacterium]